MRYGKENIAHRLSEAFMRYMNIQMLIIQTAAEKRMTISDFEKETYQRASDLEDDYMFIQESIRRRDEALRHYVTYYLKMQHVEDLNEKLLDEICKIASVSANPSLIVPPDFLQSLRKT